MAYTRAMVDLGIWKRIALPIAQVKFTLDGGGGVKAVAGITLGSPIVVTAIEHGYATGNVVEVIGVKGTTEANGVRSITVLTPNTFSLVGSTGTNAWTGGGFAVRSPIAEFDAPIVKAMSFMKVRIDDPMSPGDDDVARLTQAQLLELIDIAEYEVYDWMTTTMSSSAGAATDVRWPDVSYRIDPQATMFVQKMASDKRSIVRARYGYGLGGIRKGSLNVGVSYGDLSTEVT